MTVYASILTIENIKAHLKGRKDDLPFVRREGNAFYDDRRTILEVLWFFSPVLVLMTQKNLDIFSDVTKEEAGNKRRVIVDLLQNVFFKAPSVRDLQKAMIKSGYSLALRTVDVHSRTILHVLFDFMRNPSNHAEVVKQMTLFGRI